MTKHLSDPWPALPHVSQTVLVRPSTVDEAAAARKLPLPVLLLPLGAGTGGGDANRAGPLGAELVTICELDLFAAVLASVRAFCSWKHSAEVCVDQPCSEQYFWVAGCLTAGALLILEADCALPLDLPPGGGL